ncbi:MAG: surface lipoprotein assembly modifier [Pseudomonadota bacterium]
MTNLLRSFARSALLAAALSCVPLTASAQTLVDVQEALAAGRPDLAVARLNAIEPETDEDIRQYLFLYGLAAIELGEYAVAIDALERLVTAAPGLARPRLELARAYFLNGDDGNARQQFLLVLGGDLPPEVVANVQIFLDRIEARRDWFFSLSGGVAPDTNVNAATSSRKVTVDFGPLGQGESTNTDDAVANTGFGLELTARGGKFLPYGDGRGRFFVKGDVTSRDYANITFDDLIGTVQVGHGWQWQSAVLNVGPIHGRRWYGGDPFSITQGVRVDGGVRLAPRWTVSGFLEVAEDALINRVVDGRKQTIERIFASVGPSYSVSAKTRVGLTLGALANDGDNRDDDKSGIVVGLQFYTELANGLTFSLTPRIAAERYHAQRPNFIVTNERRSDITYSVSTEVSHRRFRFNGLQPYVQLSLSRRESVVDFYEYERVRVFAGLTRQF